MPERRMQMTVSAENEARKKQNSLLLVGRLINLLESALDAPVEASHLLLVDGVHELRAFDINVVHMLQCSGNFCQHVSLNIGAEIGLYPKVYVYEVGICLFGLIKFLVEILKEGGFSHAYVTYDDDWPGSGPSAQRGAQHQITTAPHLG